METFNFGCMLLSIIIFRKIFRWLKCKILAVHNFYDGVFYTRIIAGQCCSQKTISEEGGALIFRYLLFFFRIIKYTNVFSYVV